MGGGSSSVQVVRIYEIMDAPTGEGTRYEASDGSVWHDAQPFEHVDGDLVGDRIIPRL